MARFPSDFDPYEHDPSGWATSMAQHAELLLPCLDAVGARTVVEVGAFAGDLTRVLVAWAGERGARVVAIDPEPQASLVELDRRHPELELVPETSLGALRHIELPEVAIIDGDHNYYTVSHELQLISDRSDGGALPLLLFHDVCWPHGRRDEYFSPERIPDEYRRPLLGEEGGLFPDEPGARPGGLPYPRSAAREGGPRNGVLTAIEDFTAGREDLRLAVVPIFFGFGAVWRRDAQYGDELERILGPWDGNPQLGRLESNRVHHLALAHARMEELSKARERLSRQEAVLRRLLESSAFSVAERLSRLRMRAGVAPSQSVVSKDEVRRALTDGDASG
ncbi:MAG TPA: class I SAM-dependent methyltransferase [Thermoleophilaceae bacterium]|nr:class I SAM-dependent methyltransferase [Thermoleophilaceae bacterium]